MLFCLSDNVYGEHVGKMEKTGGRFGVDLSFLSFKVLLIFFFFFSPWTSALQYSELHPLPGNTLFWTLEVVGDA